MKEIRTVSRRNFLKGRVSPDAGIRPPVAPKSGVDPEPGFHPEPVRRHPHAVTISTFCFAKSGTACQSCGDACPEQAIRFRPRIGGPFVPELDEAACTGCGACVGVCPAGAIGVTQRGDDHA